MQTTVNDRRTQSGFTLVELLVVISVLGILAGVVVFAVGGINDRGQASACAEDARTLKTAIETFQAQNNTIPTDQNALVNAGLLTKPSTLSAFTVTAGKYTVTGTAKCATSGATGQPGTYSATVLANNPIAFYRFGETSGSVAADSSPGNRPGTYHNTISLNQTGALTADTNPAAQFNSGGPVTLAKLPVDASPGASTTVEFWMKWNGNGGTMPFGWARTDLWFSSGGFGFNNGCSNVFGVSASGLANRWVHVAAVWSNGDTTKAGILYIDGQPQTLAQFGGSPWNSCISNAVVGPDARISGWANDPGYQYGGLIDEVAIYNGALSPATVAAHFASR